MARERNRLYAICLSAGVLLLGVAIYALSQKYVLNVGIGSSLVIDVNRLSIGVIVGGLIGVFISLYFRIYIVVISIIPAVAVVYFIVLSWVGYSVGPSGPSPLRFEIKEIADVRYAYGFSVAAFTGDDGPEVTVSDSWASRFPGPPEAKVLLVNLRQNKRQAIVSGERFDFSKSPVRDVYLFERHVPHDINGDGRLDIVGVVNSHDAVVAYVAPAAPGQQWQRKLLSNKTPGAVNLALGDIDGDGDDDVVVTMRTQAATYPHRGRGVIWLQNPGRDDRGGEWPVRQIDVSASFADTRTVQLGDVNGDGRVDVVVSDLSTGLMAWFANVDGMRWVRRDIDQVSTKYAHYSKMTDWNNDGWPDLIVAHSRGVSLLINMGYGESWKEDRIFEKSRLVVFTPSPHARIITDVDRGDLDGDGKDEVIFSIMTPGKEDVGGLFYGKYENGKWATYKIQQEPRSIYEVQYLNTDMGGPAILYNCHESAIRMARVRKASD